MPADDNALQETVDNTRRALLAAREPGGWWSGELSSSALSTATAAFALHLFCDRAKSETGSTNVDGCRNAGEAGRTWLAHNQNADGGFGDTTLSLSNISTTALCWAALAANLSAHATGIAEAAQRAEHWLIDRAGGVDPDRLAPAIIARYGKDKTFSVPILTMCALAGRLGDGPEAWKKIPQLPFELAAFPQRGFKWLRLPVVSYALPALIAIGLVRHASKPSRNSIARAIRNAVRARTLNLLKRIQPQSGGFLEATPLTSFVVMSLIGAGEIDHPVVHKGIEFLLNSARADGSWPIDTNLATWVTTLSINALAIDVGRPLPEDLTTSDVGRALPAEANGSQVNDAENAGQASDSSGGAHSPSPSTPEEGWGGGCVERALFPRTPSLTLPRSTGGGDNTPPITAAAAHVRPTGASDSLRDWLLNQQYRSEHPYTLADPGAWAWTDLSGGVPDADDTPGALLALANLGPIDHRAKDAAAAGVTWLLKIQNRDGGVPTFCRGWGKLPFDRSSPDLTAHSIRAWLAWRPHLSIDVTGAIRRAVEYLIDQQRADGAWLPLWFGNQHATDDVNPTYGTSRVLKIVAPLTAARLGCGLDETDARIAKARNFLKRIQNPDGGWGGDANTPSSIEETSLALESLASLPPRAREGADCDEVMQRGARWLIGRTQSGTRFDPSPIGFYFAKLWYYESLYPMIFTLGALSALACCYENAAGSARPTGNAPT
ncbi:MAG TPA: prenyltransferase/squalene oxidase repeat-containing protein [Humisphaera sp.]|jgi:squalene-hopene/tetraprenyl-beta-curcumene cyclase|nr:prenyltransferase/squalene oxidase repeat-containing protein [Humisphaera sp.]